MKPVLVSVISDQTIPNLLIIKELQDQYESMVFITTKRMEAEQKSRWIELAAGLPPDSVARITVDENNLSDIEQKLHVFQWPENTPCMVNLTGGTKLMTLAVFRHFASGENQVIYVPIGKNNIEALYPSVNTPPTPILYRLSVKEYLTAHGLNYLHKTHPLKSFKELQRIFRAYKGKNYDIDALNAGYPDEWKKYFTGEWFEEYIYFSIKKAFGLTDPYVETALEINHFNEPGKLGNDHELDVVFTWNNELFVVEAKVSLGKLKIKSEALHQVMFKLGAISKNFGLKSNAYIITLADTNSRPGDFRKEMERKARILGIKRVIDRGMLTDLKFNIKNAILITK